MTTGRILKGLRKVTSSWFYQIDLTILYPALPSKPLNSIALYDADAASALSFVAKKLRDAGTDKSLTLEETSYVERLGGRSSDLDSVRLAALVDVVSDQSAFSS